MGEDPLEVESWLVIGDHGDCLVVVMVWDGEEEGMAWAN